MSDRPRFELNAVQLAASVLAAVTGAVLTSYLGVGGTVVGTAVGSLATTSGFAIYKHYLGRTKERIDHVAPVIVEHARVWTPTSGHPPYGRAAHAGNGTGRRSANGSAAGAAGQEDQQTQPMQAWDPGRQGAQIAGEEAAPPTQLGGAPGQVGPDQPGAGQAGAGDAPPQFGSVRLAGSGNGGPTGTGAVGEEARNGEGGQNGHGQNGHGGRNGTAGGILRGRPRWVGVAATSAAVFVLVILAITVFEFATGKPIAATIQGQKGSGTTLGGGVVTGNSGSGHATPQPTRTAAPSQGVTTPGQGATPPSQGATTPSTGQTTPQPSSGASTSPAPSSVPSPTGAPSVTVTPPASAPANGGIPIG